MAPDDLKLVRMEARLQEQQQQLMAELGLGAGAASRASGKGQANANASVDHSKEAPIVSEILSGALREPIEANMKRQDDVECCRRQSGINQPLAGIKRKVSYGACEIPNEWKSDETTTREKKPGNKLVVAGCELAQFDRSESRSEQEARKGRKVSWANHAETNQSEDEREHDGDELAPELGVIQRLAKVVPCFGILLALCASFCLGTAGMLVKLVESVHGIEVAVLRAFIQLIIYVAIICARHPRRWLPERNEMLPVAARALLGGASITFSYYAIKLIPLGDATTIRFSLPIWTQIMGYFFLGEPCSIYKLIAVVISIAGVVLVAKPDDCVRLFNQMMSILFPYNQQMHSNHNNNYNSGNTTERPHANGSFNQPEVPPDDSQQPAMTVLEETTLLVEDSPPLVVALGTSLDPLRQFEGCSMALASSVCLAMSIIALRMCKQTPSELTIFWLSMSSATIGSAALLLMGEWSIPSGWLDCGFILLNGLCGALGQWFMTNALKVEQSGLVSLARTFDIEVAFLYSALLLGEQIRLTGIIGSILVLMGVIIVLLPRLIARSNTTDAAAAAGVSDGSHTETDSTTTSSTVSIGHELTTTRPHEPGGRRSLAEANALDLLSGKRSERIRAASPPEASTDKPLV